MAEPKGKNVGKILNSLQENVHTSDEQEIDLNLSLGGLYNGENPMKNPMPQPFSQIRASASKNPALQRAIEIIRSDMHNTGIYVLESTPYIREEENAAGKGKSIVFPEGKSVKKVKHSHNVVTLMDTSDLLRTMPHVTTSGGITNGKLTEGILYSVGQDKQVLIVCFCHGRFFTPSKFVKHGGGGEVENPMKYIKIIDDASVGNI